MAFFNQLGLMGWPLAICAILMASIIIERSILFILTRSVSQKSIAQLLSQLNEADSPISIVELEKKNFGRAILSLVSKKAMPEKDRENYCSMHLMEIDNHLSQYLPILKILTTVSPLLGLLGTVLGMIESFKNITTVNQPITPALVAGGVSQALLTTAVGLMLAIPALVAHSLFQVRIGKLLHRLTIQMNEVNIKLGQLGSDENNSGCVKEMA